MAESEVEYPIIEPDEEKLLALSTGIQQRFGLELLGIDMIIENATGRYAVIDVNAFPGAVLRILLGTVFRYLLQGCEFCTQLSFCCNIIENI